MVDKTRKSFSDFVKDKMAERKMNQSDLSRSSLLSVKTVGRVYNNKNYIGSAYRATLPVVLAVSVGLKLSRAEADELLYSAFPEMKLWGCFLDRKLDIDEVNAILDENGLLPWGFKNN